MNAAKVLVEASLFECRAVAFDDIGRAFAHFITRDGEARRFAALRSVYAAVVSAHGGADLFLTLEDGPEAVLRQVPGETLTLGQRLWVRVVAEARRGKRARVALTTDPPSPMTGLDLWRQGLPGGFALACADVAPGDARIAAAFDEALATSVPLAGGGVLHIESARALTAADVDASAREAKGSAAARALSLNRVAAETLARQMALRNIGGNLVLDCVAPLNRESGAKIRTAFQNIFARYTTRKANVLPPSPLGLMEASLEWGAAPVADRLLGANLQLSPETLTFDGLRVLEREARAQPMARLTLGLPRDAYYWLKANVPGAQNRLDAAFGARLTIAAHTDTSYQVFEDR
jgi:ribonuclease E